jgi:hypothetical protein
MPLVVRHFLEDVRFIAATSQQGFTTFKYDIHKKGPVKGPFEAVARL